MTTCSGHRSWNAWNVSLWINSDEPLYRFALECKRKGKTLGHATRLFMAQYGGEKTPDGAACNATCVREALSGLE